MKATDKQQRHLDRKWMQCLKREFQHNKAMREIGLMLRLNPQRLPR